MLISKWDIRLKYAYNIPSLGLRIEVILIRICHFRNKKNMPGQHGSVFEGQPRN